MATDQPLAARQRALPSRLLDLAAHPDAAILGLWLGASVVLAGVTYRIADWFKVPDEMVFQRLAQSIGRDHSLLPRIHGEFIRSLNQLYPLLISPIVAGGYVADDLPQIRVLNAVVVTSACIPAYLLAKRVTGRRGLAYLLAFLSICLPWLVLTPFILTEVVALPAFLWAMLAFQRALVQPSVRNDLVAVAAILVAIFARTQFVVLFGVLLLAVVLYARRTLWATHRVLVVLYAAGGVTALIFELAGGRLLSLSIYGEQFGRGLTPHGVPGWALGHAADLAFTLGILPFLVGGAWLLANAVRRSATAELHAFACIGACTVVLLIYAVTTFDLQLGGFIFDRYLMYLWPVLLLAFACALHDVRRPRWSLALPAAAVAAGFVLHPQQEFTWRDPQLNSDAPPAILYRPIVDAVGGRGAMAWTLAGATVVVALLFAVLAARVSRERLAIVLLALAAVALPLETGYLFVKLLGTVGPSLRPLTRSNASALDWVDRTVGRDAQVTIAPYPVSGAFIITQQYWRDVEFWNKSVARQIDYPGPDFFAYTGYWFPKVTPRFDERTGASSFAETRYALQSIGETRFRLAGSVIQQTREAMLIDVGRPWRLAWLTNGLYKDGWTRPGTPARVRVYAPAGASGAVTHYLTLQFRSAGDRAARVSVRSNLQQRTAAVEPGATATLGNLLVCVPADGFADVTVSTPADGEIPGGQVSFADSETPRRGGVLVSGIALAGETAGPCTP